MYELEIKIANNNSIKFICQNINDPLESYCLIMTLKEFVHFHSVFENENSINDIYNKIARSRIIMKKKNNIYIILEISIENTTLQFDLKYKNNNNNNNIFSYIRIFNPENAINFLNKHKILFIIAVLVLVVLSLILGSIALDKTRKIEKLVSDFTQNFEIIKNVQNIEEQLNQKVDKFYIDNLNDNSIPYNEKPFSYYVNLKNDFTALESEFNKIKMQFVNLGENFTKHFNNLDTYIDIINNDLSNLKGLKSDYLINKNSVSNNILLLNTSLTNMNNNYTSKFSNYDSDILIIKNNLNKLNNDSNIMYIMNNDLSNLKDLTSDYLITKHNISNNILLLNNSINFINNDIIYINENLDLFNDLESDIILDINAINLKLNAIQNNISVNKEYINMLINEKDNNIQNINSLNAKLNDYNIIITNYNNTILRFTSEISILKDFREKSLEDYNFFYNKDVKQDNDINNLYNSLKQITEEIGKYLKNTNSSRKLNINIIYLIIINSLFLL